MLPATEIEPPRLFNDLFVLGVPASGLRVVALLPHLEVAWSDGILQASERDIIVRIADSMALDEPSADLLLNWLTYQPTPGVFAVGRRALQELVGRAFVSDEVPALVATASEVAHATASVLRGITEQQRDVLDRLNQLAEVARGRAAAGLSEAALPRVGRGPAQLALANPATAWDLDRRELLLGRARQCDVHIRHDPEVSRQHARLVQSQRGWSIHDLKSARGTWVNGQRVVRRALLGGEVIELGEDTQLRFQVAFQDPRANAVVTEPAQIGHTAQGA